MISKQADIGLESISACFILFNLNIAFFVIYGPTFLMIDCFQPLVSIDASFD